jgi:Bacterial pre-peptidase C-terminal domain
MHKVYCYYLLIPVLCTIQLILSDRAGANPRTSIEPPAKIDKPLAIYVPMQLPANGEVKDILSDRDIPTGEGGFARDYAIKLTAGDNIAIDLTSEVFDTVVILLNAEGKNIGKNDDGADGSSNSLLFTRIKNAGNYIIRVQGFGETSSGEFKLKVTKLKEK